MLVEAAPDARPAWPERVIELAAEWKRERGHAAGDRVLGELWQLVHAGLSRYLRMHGGSHARLTREDLRDIASEKSLELLRKLHDGTWDPCASSAGELCSFLSTLARNGLVDGLRIAVREQQGSFEPAPVGMPVESGHLAAQRYDYVRALSRCATALHPRMQRIWFLRVFLELPSRDIARHPDVGTSPGAVDVALVRCRAWMAECIRSKGFEPKDMPPGTFAALWEALYRPR
jgi:DNA-directed RNA polymerase specialized sigma24 family protein